MLGHPHSYPSKNTPTRHHTPDSPCSQSSATLHLESASLPTDPCGSPMTGLHDRLSSWSLTDSLDRASIFSTPRAQRFTARIMDIAKRSPLLRYPTVATPMVWNDDLNDVFSQRSPSPCGDESELDVPAMDMDDASYQSTPSSETHPRYCLRSRKRRSPMPSRQSSVSSEGSIRHPKKRKLPRHPAKSSNAWNPDVSLIDEDTSDTFGHVKRSSSLLEMQDTTPIVVGIGGGVKERGHRRSDSMADKLCKLVQHTQVDLSHHNFFPQRSLPTHTQPTYIIIDSDHDAEDTTDDRNEVSPSLLQPSSETPSETLIPDSTVEQQSEMDTSESHIVASDPSNDALVGPSALETVGSHKDTTNNVVLGSPEKSEAISDDRHASSLSADEHMDRLAIASVASTGDDHPVSNVTSDQNTASSPVEKDVVKPVKSGTSASGSYFGSIISLFLGR
ncbi:uncharacterized protein BYT42DRAFT_413352 [Radiomyces spectabilis]|uniref:uncharacterized protein n=1 Tax=Radiomyces spectabilis TaxID=64574 RepID=UPI00221E9668|nr:uncharacterized protein BYT42DRAFT_413352 [Radiomyces spectabilis]KAI8374616.1 hypothetical protein BYT42DRAFT_413352 [Radiomyces spectabilis]